MTGSKNACLHWLEEQPEGRYEVREARQKRSRSQNSYYWSLLNELAASLGLPVRECHMNMLRDYSRRELFAFREDVPAEDYFPYCELAYYTENGMKAYFVYKESHRMNTKEFSRLLNGLIEECKLQGIPTETPEQIALLRRE